MSDNFKDICEQDPSEREDERTAIAAASSIPWASIEEDPEGLLDAAITELSDDLAEAGSEASPVLEINRGEILFARRTITLQPQQNVFITAQAHVQARNKTKSSPAQRWVDLPLIDPSEYLNDPIATTINLVDPLRFVLGKTFHHRGGDFSETIFVEEDDLENFAQEDLYEAFDPATRPFRLINPRSILRNRESTNHNPLGLYFDYQGAQFNTISAATFTIIKDCQLYSHSPLFFSSLEGSSTDEADKFLLRYIPSADRTFEEFRFSSPACLFESESSFISGPPGIYASVSAHLPTSAISRASMTERPESPNNQPASDYYESDSVDRSGKKNIYVDYLSSHPQTIVRDFNGAPVQAPRAAEDICYEEVVSEKYPSHAVRALPDLNNSILEATQGDAQTGQLIRWIDSVSPEFVEVSFDTPPASEFTTDFAAAFESTGTDALLLAALDARFSKMQDELPLFSDLSALSLSSVSFDQEITANDYYLEPGAHRPLRGNVTFQSPNQKYIGNYRPRMIKGSFRFMEDLISSSTPELESQPEDLGLPISEIFKRSEFPMLFDLHENLDSTNSRRVMKTQLEQRVMLLGVTIEDILQNNFMKMKPFGHYLHSSQMCHSETVAFRVEKTNALTGKVIKEFYFFNASDSEEIKFIDSEVTLSSRYVYNAYAINIVCATTYRYTDAKTSTKALEDRPTTTAHILGPGDPVPEPSVEFTYELNLDLRVIETPYFSQEVSVTDLPPMSPRADLESFGHDTSENVGRFRFRFSPDLATISEVPIQIVEQDQPIIARMLENQPNRSARDIEQGRIKYSGIDSEPIYYEMLVLKSPPQNYSDFSFATSYKTDPGSSVRKFKIEPNSPRFLIFRTRDRGGLSNPSRIFKFTYHSYADGDYYEYELYEPELNQSSFQMTCERYFSIKPAFQQSIIDYGITDGSSQSEVLSALESAPSLEQLGIGTAPAEESIWDKKFKIRIRSVNTGKAIDFNLVHKVLSSSPSSARTGQNASAVCTGEVGNKNETISRGLHKSKEELKEKTSQALAAARNLSGESAANLGRDRDLPDGQY
jgi:hypothetical protein